MSIEFSYNFSAPWLVGVKFDPHPALFCTLHTRAPSSSSMTSQFVVRRAQKINSTQRDIDLSKTKERGEMKKRFGMLLILVLVCLSLLSFSIQPAEATGTVQILADGSIDPPTAPIITNDNVTYTLTGDITSDADGIVILKDDILLDGAGYTVKGSDLGPYMAVKMDGRTNVTIRNMKITESWFGIHLSDWLVDSSGNAIFGNTITSTQYGIVVGGSSNQMSENLITNSSNGIYVSGYSNYIVGNNVTANSVGIWVAWDATGNAVTGNNITNNGFGVRVYIRSIANSICENQIRANDEGIVVESYSSNNNLSSNNITENNDCGIFIDSSSSNNTISANNIAANWDGIWLRNSESNTISGNNITTNAGFGTRFFNSSNNRIYNNNYANYYQVLPIISSVNYLDDGYPSGGNFWSDYSGSDFFNGPYQNITGSDGIGDIPYFVGANNTDHYPLMKPYPWASHDIGIALASSAKTVVGQNYTTSLDCMLFNYGNYIETLDSEFYANSFNIASQTTDVAGRNFSISNVKWNTTGFAYGNYTISAFATPTPEETDISDNNCTLKAPIHVGVSGDISGSTQGVYDGTCNMRDIQYLILRFNTNPSSLNWNPNADVNGDNTVNMRDIQIAILNFNKHE